MCLQLAKLSIYNHLIPFIWNIFQVFQYWFILILQFKPAPVVMSEKFVSICFGEISPPPQIVIFSD